MVGVVSHRVRVRVGVSAQTGGVEGVEGVEQVSSVVKGFCV